MNDRLTRKKHSKRIAGLALQAGLIDAKFYASLYLESYERQRRPKRKYRNGKYRLTRYYTELYYAVCDYWGEWDEVSLISYVNEILYWELNKMDDEGNALPPVIKIGGTLDTIRKLIKYKERGLELRATTQTGATEPSGSSVPNAGKV